MPILYDVPAGKSAVIDGPAELRVHGSGPASRYQLYNTGAGPSPAPVIGYIAPTTAPAGSLTIDVAGSNFANTAVVVCNGVAVPTNFVSDTMLRGTITGTAGAKNVLVRDGAVDSNVKVFTFT